MHTVMYADLAQLKIRETCQDSQQVIGGINILPSVRRRQPDCPGQMHSAQEIED